MKLNKFKNVIDNASEMSKKKVQDHLDNLDVVALQYAQAAEKRSIPRNDKTTLDIIMDNVNKYQVGDYVEYLYGEDQTPEYGKIIKLPKSDGIFSISSGKLRFKIHQDQITRKIVDNA